MSNSGIDDHFMAHALREFALESDAQFMEVEAALLQLEKKPDSFSQVDTVFRNFHTIKGSAGIFGFDELESYCHGLETELALYRDGTKGLDTHVNSLLLQCNDHVRQLVQIQSKGAPVPAGVSQAGQLLMKALRQGRGAPPEGADVPQLEAATPLRSPGTLRGTDPGDSHLGNNASLRIDAGKLDYMIGLVSELVIEQSMAHARARQLGDFALNEHHERMEKMTESVRQASLELRMVPIADTLNRFNRVVRDVAETLGKKVRLDIVGGETELDKSLVDKIADPLMHMVRNALDHGLEHPEERLNAGKSEVGRLVIEARHDGGHVTLRVEDDGRGMDRQQIVSKAVAQGLIPADQKLEEHEIFALIFTPGFSTAETISKLSGRGVGMDVVKRGVAQLRGAIHVESDYGKGTRFNIRLPLTLASFDGFMLGVGQTQFVVPTGQIQEVVRSENTSSGEQTLSFFEYRGKPTPLLHLRELFRLDSPRGSTCSIVVVQHNGENFGMKVDHLVGQRQTVVKPLGRLFQKLPGIAGSSLLGDGNVALVLDLNSLLAMANGA